MQLYKYDRPLVVAPGADAENACNQYKLEMQHIEPDRVSSDYMEVLIDHEDYGKLFMVANCLVSSELVSRAELDVMVQALAQEMGYSLPLETIAQGICGWAERFGGWDRPDVEAYLNKPHF